MTVGQLKLKLQNADENLVVRFMFISSEDVDGNGITYSADDCGVENSTDGKMFLITTNNKCVEPQD